MAVTTVPASTETAVAPVWARVVHYREQRWIPGDEDRLGTGERIRVARFGTESLRRRYVGAHLALRHLLAEQGVAPGGRLSFRTEPKGRPVLVGAASGWHFGISYADYLSVVAVSPEPVGVDCESLDVLVDEHGIIDGWMSDVDAACIRRRCGGTLRKSFLRHWTVREAFLKWTGDGLSEMRSLDVACKDQPVVWFRGDLQDQVTVRTMERHCAQVSLVYSGGALYLDRCGGLEPQRIDREFS